MTSDIVCFLIRLLCGATARWPGGKPDESVTVYYANHASHLDYLLVWAALPREVRRRIRPVAAADYWSRGRIRRFLAERVFQALLVNRRRPTRTDNPLTAMVSALESGDSLLIFPEGTRSDDGTIGAFRSGLYHLAHRAPQARLVPVYLDNLTRILPKGEHLAVPLLSSVTFARPLERVEGESKEDFLARARRVMEECKP